MILGRSPFVVMSRNCLVWSEGIFRWFADKEAIRKKYILWSKTKFGILKLHDIPPCLAQLPHNCACGYRVNMENKTEQDNTEHE